MSALHELDLNLIIALHALLHEGHVTRAGARVGLSQSAMSRALGRLRELLDDELLVKTQTGMSYSPLALTLLPQVTALVASIEQTLSPRFEPHTSQRVVHLPMCQYAQLLYGARLWLAARAQAPGPRTRRELTRREHEPAYGSRALGGAHARRRA